MSEKRFIACDKWADSEGNIFKFVVIDTKKLGDKQFILRCNHWSQAQDTCNRLNDTLDDLRRENEQLRLELDTHKHPLWSTREAERKVNKLADSLADEVKKNGLLNEEINQLRIENMRLKKKYNEW